MMVVRFNLAENHHWPCQLAVVGVETREGWVFRGWCSTVTKCWIFMICSMMTTEINMADNVTITLAFNSYKQ